MSTRSSTSVSSPVRKRGLVDTSVLIELEFLRASALPSELAVSAVSVAELTAGPHATDDRQERARRQDRLQRIQSTFDSLPFDGDAARAYGQIYAAVRSAGRKPRGRRFADLLIAATALAAGLPLYTCNPDDFAGLGDLLEVVRVEVPPDT